MGRWVQIAGVAYVPDGDDGDDDVAGEYDDGGGEGGGHRGGGLESDYGTDYGNIHSYSPHPIHPH